MRDPNREWAQFWRLPIIGMLGIAGIPLFSYASGVMVGPVTAELGWTRTQFYSAISLNLLAGMLVVPWVGSLVDRIGARRVAVAGALAFVLGISAMSLAQSDIRSWWALSVLLAICSAFITQAVWVRPIVARFDASRGLALAVALSGNGIATMLWPAIASVFVGSLGWRMAFPAMAVCWAVLAVPFALAWLPGHSEERVSPEIGVMNAEPLPPVAPVVLSRAFLCLTAAGGLLACVTFGLTLHFVPMLRERGIAMSSAAAIAGAVGFFAILGRLIAGYLLDRFPARIVASAVFLLPGLACGLLLGFSGGTWLAIAAAALVGLASGAEIDIVAFMTARDFDARIFGSLYAIIIAVFGFLAGVGPLLAGALYDAAGNYHAFLAVAAALSLISAGILQGASKHQGRDADGARPDPSIA